MKTRAAIASSLFTLGLLAACGEAPVDTPPAAPAAPPAASATAPAASDEGCVDEANISYLCGLVNAEDALRLGNSQWLIVSGMNGELGNDASINGKIHLVDHEAKTWEVLFPGETTVMELNAELYGSCPGPLDITNFSAHGLALRALDTGPEQYRLYMTSHGAREAVEIFEIDGFVKPTIKWVGCVPMPATSWTNSLVILDDWGFLATQFMDPTGSGMAGVIAKEITGHVFEWHPGGDVGVIAGTELSGPNGIEITDDGRFIYVAAFGTHEVVRFDLSTTPPEKESVAITVAPDNIRWSSDGTLYTAGGNVTEDCSGPVCGTGWSVIEVVPYDMTARRLTGVDQNSAMRGVSSALLVDDEIWVGTYGGDRVGIMPKP